MVCWVPFKSPQSQSVHITGNSKQFLGPSVVLFFYVGNVVNWRPGHGVPSLYPKIILKFSCKLIIKRTLHTT